MSTNCFRRGAALVAAAMLTACMEAIPFAPSAHDIVVHAVLDAAARQQDVYVQTTSGDVTHAEGVVGAVVTLTLPDGRVVTAAQKQDTVRFQSPRLATPVAVSYRFSLDQLGFAIVPGGTYRLRVVLPDGRAVTGHTTVPTATAVSLSQPNEEFNSNSSVIRMDWPRISGARSYEVAVAPDTGLAPPRALFADTTVRLDGSTLGTDGSRLFAPGKQRLIVSAVDSNYYDYYRRSSDQFTGVGVVGHLDGAYGVFGSIVEIAVRALTVR